MAYDSEDGYVVLFGGCPGYGMLNSCGSQTLADTWAFSDGTWTKLTPYHPPPGRSAAVLADDPSLGGLVLYGGTGPNGTLNDTWEFQRGEWSQLSPAHSPPALELATMAYDSAAGELVLFGGLLPGSLTASNQTWVFQSGTWTNQTLAGGEHPTGWIASVLAPDPTGGVLAYGGITAPIFPTYTQETWRFASGTWTNITAAAGSSVPSSRAFGFGVYSPSVDDVVLFGGGTAVSMPRDVWTYGTGGTWKGATPGDLPPNTAFYATQACWDGADGYVIAFAIDTLGSFYGIPTIASVLNQTWALLSPLTSAVTGTVNVTVGSNSTFQAGGGGGVGPYRYHWDFGDGTTTTTVNATHKYAAPGSYQVYLNLTDHRGNVSTSHIVAVIAAPSTPATSAGPQVVTGLLTAGAIVAAGLVGSLVPRRK